jgi:hypothetical protein
VNESPRHQERLLLTRQGHLSTGSDLDAGVFATLSSLNRAIRVQPSLSSGFEREWRALEIGVRRFHEAFDLSRHELIDERRRARIYRVSHQPDFFAGLNVTGAALLLSSITPEWPGTVVCHFVDYSTSSDPKLRSSPVPMGLDEFTFLRAGIPSSLRDRVAWSIGPPSLDLVDEWARVLHNSLLATSRVLRARSAAVRHIGESRALLRDLHERWRRFAKAADSMTAFNAAVTIDLLQRVSPFPIVGLEGSRLLANNGEAVEAVVTGELSHRGLTSPQDWWHICGNCLRRNVCEWTAATHKLESRCSNCETIYLDDCGISSIISTSLNRPQLVPKVRTDVLIEYSWLPATCQGSYAGSLNHLVSTRRIAVASGLRVPPELVWDPSDLVLDTATALPPGGKAAELLAAGKVALVVYFLLFEESWLFDQLISGSVSSRPGALVPLLRLDRR